MGWRIRLRANEACDDPQAFLSPDIIIQDYLGAEIRFDHELALDREESNRGGLRSVAGLNTSVVIQLFSDRRVRDEQDLPDSRDPNPRGWWGDSVDVRDDLGETEIGSHLWLLRRSVLTQEVLDLAADYVEEALQPIVDQGAVSRFVIETEAQNQKLGGLPASVLAIGVDGLSFDGRNTYQQHFEVLWDQVREMARDGL